MITITILLNCTAFMYCMEQRNNNLSLTITNNTNLYFLVHRSDGITDLPSGMTYNYQQSFSFQELMLYKSQTFTEYSKPFKKWFNIVSDPRDITGNYKDIVLDLLLYHSSNVINIEAQAFNHFKERIHHNITSPFNVKIHLLLATLKDKCLLEQPNLKASVLKIVNET